MTEISIGNCLFCMSASGHKDWCLYYAEPAPTLPPPPKSAEQKPDLLAPVHIAGAGWVHPKIVPPPPTITPVEPVYPQQLGRASRIDMTSRLSASATYCWGLIILTSGGWVDAPLIRWFKTRRAAKMSGRQHSHSFAIAKRQR